jgi:hypothetical protein
MFTRAFGQGTKEGFATAAIPTDPKSMGIRKIQQYFTETLPNVIYSRDKKLDLEYLTRSGNGSSVIKNTRIKLNTSNGPAEQRNAECAATGNGDQFDHLVSLSSSQNGNSKTRCGWIYNSQNPEKGRAAYGVMSGPLVNSDTTGTWMWNLQEAKEKYHKSICDKVMGCEDISSSLYNNRCGWNTKAGKAIPIQNGNVAYPYNPLLNCSADNLVTKPQMCPKPVPRIVLNEEGKPVQLQSPAAGVCTPLPNGSLSRDCLIQRSVAAGCSEDGTLAYALKAGSDMNYTDVLSRTQAYKTYQERAVVGLDPTSLKTGKIAAAQALEEFKRVNDHASSAQNGALEFASRDLCFKRGVMDTFDFCSELNPSTRGPFTLDCLQKAFLRAGGQKTGTLFPKDTFFWNSRASKWSDVNIIIQEIIARLSSSNRKEQENAMKEFYGITLESKASVQPVPFSAVKYIRLEGGGPGMWLNFSQIVGYDMNGVNVTEGRSVTASPTSEGTNASNAVNGNERLMTSPNQYHSSSQTNVFFQVELDSPTRLSYVRIFNREDCCQDRLASYKLILLDANGNKVWLSPLTGNSVQTIQIRTQPSTADLSDFQEEFNKAGCKRILQEGHVGWWRGREWHAVINDMKAYAGLTANCSGSSGQHDFCNPGKCK